MQRVAILGGGIGGLAAAFRLQELAAATATALEIQVYERTAQAGGCLQTLRDDGVILELGPDSLLVDKPAALHLLRRLQLEDSIIDMRPEFKGARIVHAGRLHRIPPEFRLFTPKSLPALLTSGIFSAFGLARAAMEPLIPKRTDIDDESLASFVTRRFGREVLDRLAQPLIGGIYSADPERLSMRATLPQFLEMEERYGSMLRAMRAATPAAPPRLASLRGGIGSIVDALRARIGSALHTSSDVTSLRQDERMWTIGFADGTLAQADAVILALPAYAAADLLSGVQPQLAALLEHIRYNSIVTVNLVYGSQAGAALAPCTGFVVPFIERRRITAATFATQKYAHRAPEGTTLLRAFIGGALQPDLLDRSDDELAALAHEELAALADVGNPPARAVVSRWNRLAPEYAVGHVDRVRDIERLAQSIGGIALAGSAYHGVGIPDCIATGEASAESVFGYIRA